MEARKRRRHHGNKDTTNWITPLWSFLGNGSPVFHPRNDYPLKPWKKSVGGVDGIWWISTVCKFAKKKRKRKKRVSRPIEQSLPCFYRVSRTETREGNFVESWDIRGASQFRALRSAGTCTIQPLKSSGCIHPSFSLFLKHQDYVMNAGKCSTTCGFHTSTIYFTVTTVNGEWNDAKK